MSPGLADVPQNVEQRVKSPRNTFEREPLLIPQLFVNGKPWYRRRETIVRVVLSAIFLLMVAYILHRYSVIGIFKMFAKIAG